MTKKRKAPSVPYNEGLIQRLKNPHYAVEYLNAILSDKAKGLQERLLSALQFVLKAHGASAISQQTQLQRESLRKALSEKGNPTLSTLLALLKAFGIQFRFEAINAAKPIAVASSQEADLAMKIDQIQATLNEVLVRPNVVVVDSSGKELTITQAEKTNIRAAMGSTATLSVDVNGAKNVH